MRHMPRLYCTFAALTAAIAVWGCGGKVLVPAQEQDAGPGGSFMDAPPDGPIGPSVPTQTQGTCTRGNWCWQNNFPQGLSLSSVWTFGPTDTWAVGEEGSVLHWNGSQWSSYPVDSDETFDHLWGANPLDLWMTGSQGSLWHWDGSSWSRLWSFGDPNAKFGEVRGIGPNEAWITGKGIYHWDGQALQLWSVPVAGSNGTEEYSALWGSDNNDVWAVGTRVANESESVSVVAHWDGTSWSVQSTGPLASGLDDIWGISGSDVWAIGSVWGDAWYQKSVHWDGSQWSATRVWEFEHNCSQLWGLWSNDIWAACAGGMRRWDGQKWSVDVPTIEHSYNAVHGSSGNNVWAVGSAGRIAKWNGEQWSSPNNGVNIDITTLWAASENEVWAVGYGNSPSYAPMLHWDGTRWQPESLPNRYSDVVDIWGTDKDHLWAVAGGNTIWHRVQGQWIGEIGEQYGDWLGVWAQSEKDAWVVGWKGHIEHWDGTGWREVESGTTQNLTAVRGRASNDVWAVGWNDTILHWDGRQWTPSVMAPHTQSIDFETLWVQAPDLAWAWGNEGLLRWDGQYWTAEPNAPSATYEPRLWGTASGELWAANGTQALYHYHKQSGWTVEQVPAQVQAIAVANGTVWVGGQYGALLSRH